MNISEVIEKVLKNKYGHGTDILSLRCCDIQQALYLLSRIDRKLRSLKDSVLFRMIKVLKIAKVENNTLLSVKRRTLFGSQIKGKSMYRDYLNLLDRINGTIRDSGKHVEILNNLRMRDINRLIKPSQTFGALASKGEYIRLKDKIRKQNQSIDPRSVYRLINKVPSDLLEEMISVWNINIVIVGRVGIDIVLVLKKKQEKQKRMMRLFYGK